MLKIHKLYKSNDEFERDYIYDGDLNSVAIYIAQLVIFGRIIKERSEGEFNLPDGEVPLYLRQVNEKNNKDFFDISTGRLIKKWARKNKKKIEYNIWIIQLEY